jgi:hypothetical protein
MDWTLKNWVKELYLLEYSDAHIAFYPVGTGLE